MDYQFVYDRRLGIPLPVLKKEWDLYSLDEQEQILAEWEDYRADIPQRVKDLEALIERKQAELSQEERFEHSCRLNQEISQLASTINDLNIWFRIQQEVHHKKHK